ncbi:hypothetical protein MBLNU459_g2941t1 [Dothideomycetes sp. NU459]
MAEAESHEPILALIEYEDVYVQPLILAALRAKLPPDLLVLIRSSADIPSSSQRVLQWRQYEALDWEEAMRGPTTSLINSYVIRKALIRKHYLSATISHWLTKHPESKLSRHVKPSVEFELDYAEFLDDALVEAFELKESFEHNENAQDSEKQWWILKPGMSDRGQGIRLFSSEEELTAIFEEWDPESDDEDEDEASYSDGGTANNDSDNKKTSDGSENKDDSNGIITSQLRHFVAQPYISPPLLLPAPFPSADRKFHIRTYVVAVGALQVHVYKPMLALFAGAAYSPPCSGNSGSGSDAEMDGPNAHLNGHLTNTCLQSGEREGSVHAFWSLPSSVPGLSAGWKDEVYEQICGITGEVFEAAARGMMVHFQPLPNAFEIFGLDFMVDGQGTPWLLEVNAFPDFAQTGEDLGHLIKGLFEEVVDVAVKPFFGLADEAETKRDGKRMTKVLDIDLGRR